MFQPIASQEGMPEKIQIYYDEERAFLFGASIRSGEAEFPWESLEELAADWTFLGDRAVSFALFLWRDHNDIRTKFFSATTRVRALEFLNALFADMGLVKGDSVQATGQISQPLLWTQINKENKEDLMDYILGGCCSYFEDTDWIEAGRYAKEHREELLALPHYHKRHVPWSFVSTLDIAPKGSRLYVRSLENEDGFEVETGENMIIMIGSQGEVYHMKREKFEATYDATDELLDIFSNMTVFLPEVRLMPKGEYINIDEIAHVCYPKPGNAIFAKQIEKRTKIFPVYNPEGYFLGKPGDYMVARSDDLSDIYILQEKIF
ncbi:MAG: hypothetical protein IJ679_05730 [Lachnospiraceae bacterium]|nr:hypothetical protein [Lachnospiraceae bacterium]